MPIDEELPWSGRSRLLDPPMAISLAAVGSATAGAFLYRDGLGTLGALVMGVLAFIGIICTWTAVRAGVAIPSFRWALFRSPWWIRCVVVGYGLLSVGLLLTFRSWNPI